MQISNNASRMPSAIKSTNRYYILKDNDKHHEVHNLGIRLKEMRKETKNTALYYIESISETVLDALIKLHANDEWKEKDEELKQIEELQVETLRLMCCADKIVYE